MNRRSEYAVMFVIGAVCYGLIEIAWRGRTHCTMLLTGGLCLLLLHRCNERHADLDLWSRCGLGCLTITAVEFSVGWLFNVRLHMMIWDYSDKFLNLAGQVCLEYTAYWYLLSVPAMALSSGVLRMRDNTKKKAEMRV